MFRHSTPSATSRFRFPPNVVFRHRTFPTIPETRCKHVFSKLSKAVSSAAACSSSSGPACLRPFSPKSSGFFILFLRTKGDFSFLFGIPFCLLICFVPTPLLPLVFVAEPCVFNFRVFYVSRASSTRTLLSNTTAAAAAAPMIVRLLALVCNTVALSDVVGSGM